MKSSAVCVQGSTPIIIGNQLEKAVLLHSGAEAIGAAASTFLCTKQTQLEPFSIDLVATVSTTTEPRSITTQPPSTAFETYKGYRPILIINLHTYYIEIMCPTELYKEKNIYIQKRKLAGHTCQVIGVFCFVLTLPSKMAILSKQILEHGKK